LRLRRISEPLAVASQIADLTTEMAAQLVYTLFGVGVAAAILTHATSPAQLLWTTELALGAGVLLFAAFVAFQGKSLDLAGALAGRWLKDMRERAEATKATLREIYAQPPRLVAGVLLHGAGWLLSGAGSWLAFRFMGVEVALWKVFALESLMAAVKSVAFLTPGGLGFQEGAYVLVAPMFGLTPEANLAVSLIRRAKDLLIGVAAVLAWQYFEIAARPREARS
jgi:putative membrane protein